MSHHGQAVINDHGTDIDIDIDIAAAPTTNPATDIIVMINQMVTVPGRIEKLAAISGLIDTGDIGPINTTAIATVARCIDGVLLVLQVH